MQCASVQKIRECESVPKMSQSHRGVTTATHYTPEQAKDHYVAAMGEDLGRIFYALWQDVFWLHNEWDEYLQLFGTKPSRIKLMNDAAPSFFRMIQNELVQMIVLRIARLTDPPRSTGKSNLTIQQLVGMRTSSCASLGV